MKLNALNPNNPHLNYPVDQEAKIVPTHSTNISIGERTYVLTIQTTPDLNNDSLIAQILMTKEEFIELRDQLNILSK